MIKIDVIIPVCGEHGGVEAVLNDWNNNIDRSRFELRFIIFNGTNTFFDKKDNVFLVDSNAVIINCEIMELSYEEVVKAVGAPDICIASIWPFVTKACKNVVDKMNLPTKVVSWIHNNIEEFNEGEVLGTIEDLLWADYHLCINKKLSEDLHSLDSDVNTFEIGNPVRSRASSLYNPSPRTLAYVGRLNRQKRIDTVIKALSMTKNKWSLKIIGDGEDMQLAKELVYSFDLDNQVTMLGWQSEPFSHLMDTAVMVTASETEGFSVAVIEALSLGMNVISTSNPGAVDVIVPGENGYLFEVGDYAGLAGILDEIDAGKKQLGAPEICKKTVEEYLTENYYVRLDHIFEEIVAGN